MVKVMTAHQPLYLPWLGFFQKVSMSDTFCLMDDVQFEKSSFIHRNTIKSHNGPVLLTVPVHTESFLDKTIRDMTIDNSRDWGMKHWCTMKTSYGNSAPYFESYGDFFKEVYRRKWDKIAELDEYILKYLFRELKINVDMVKASDIGFTGKKNDRLVDMLVKMNSDLMILGQTGETYTDQKIYADAGKAVCFQKYRHPRYPQLHGPFVPNLSAVDLLFCYGEKSYDILTRNNPTRQELISKYLSKN